VTRCLPLWPCDRTASSRRTVCAPIMSTVPRARRRLPRLGAYSRCCGVDRSGDLGAVVTFGRGGTARRCGELRVALRGAAGPRLPGLPRRVGGADVPRTVPAAVGGPAPVGSASRPAGRWRVAGAAALFVAGFTAVFASMLLGAVEVADALVRSELLLQRIDGVVHARSTRPSSRSPAWVRSSSPSAWPCRKRRPRAMRGCVGERR